MKHFTSLFSLILIIQVSSVQSQSLKSESSTKMNGFDLWVGDWTMDGTSKDAPNAPEYKIHWNLHGNRILGDFFIQVDHLWKGDGMEQKWLEIISYDADLNLYHSYGFLSDGSSWVATATFNGKSYVENGITKTADGKNANWHCTWTFSDNMLMVSGTQEWEQEGAHWISFAVKGTKAK